ncbi:hypothetical protein ACLOJK_041887 [Asimina triloba]
MEIYLCLHRQQVALEASLLSADHQGDCSYDGFGHLTPSIDFVIFGRQFFLVRGGFWKAAAVSVDGGEWHDDHEG